MDSGNEGNKQLYRYAGMATQFLVSIGLGVFMGLKIDQWTSISFPLFVWLLPLLVISGMLYVFIKDTSTRK
ncbi:MAG: AtpZ/AtpI family protein [Ginsengibacter sp.]